MKVLKTTFIRALLLGAPLAVAPALSVNVLSQFGLDASFAQVQAQKEQQATRKTPALTQPVYKKLAEALVLINPEDEGKEPDFNAALKVLKKLESKDAAKWNEYELANLYNNFGYVYYSLENYAQAVKYYNLVVAQSPNIPVGLEISTLYTIAQLQFVQEDFRGAIATLEKWFKVQDPVFINADNYALLATAYYQNKQFDKSLANVDKAIAMYKEKGEVPKENWYSIKMAIQYDREKYREVAEILEILVRNYPKISYFKQLAGMYNLIKKEKQSVYLTDATYVAGALDKEGEVLNVAYMMLGEEYPYRAAKILEQAIKEKVVEPTSKNLDTLATAWSLAQETDKSIAVLEEAAAKADTGNLYAKLAGNYVDKDKNREALAAGKKALDRGDIKREDQLQVVIGMANANLGNWDACKKAFRQARKDKRSEAFASNWLKYCQGEQEREQSLGL